MDNKRESQLWKALRWGFGLALGWFLAILLLIIVMTTCVIIVVD